MPCPSTHKEPTAGKAYFTTIYITKEVKFTPAKEVLLFLATTGLEDWTEHLDSGEHSRSQMVNVLLGAEKPYPDAPNKDVQERRTAMRFSVPVGCC